VDTPHCALRRYEGPAVLELLHWLRAGRGIEAEAPLLRALEAMPVPMKGSAGG